MSSRLTIAQTCRVAWPHVGGMESVIHGLSRALVARGHRVEVWSLRRGLRDGEVLPPTVHEGVRYRRLTRMGPRRYPLASGLVSAVRGVDLVHHHGLDGMADQLVWRRSGHGAAVGISTHGGFVHTGRHARLKQLWARALTRRSLARADAVWFTSRVDEAAWGDLVDGTVLPDGVALDRWQRIARRPERGVWLVLGRVDVHKGLERLVDAVGVLQRRGRAPLRVDVVGPEARAGLVTMLRDRAVACGVGDRFRWMGAQSDAEVERRVASCEWAVFPSTFESFGVAVVEVMAAGVCPVVSELPAHRDRVGEAGLVVDFSSPEQAADQLERLPTLPRSTLEALARTRASRWSWSEVADRVERAYEAALGARGEW